MREFTFEQKMEAARDVVKNIEPHVPLRPSTYELMAEAWAGGEETYAVSNQYAINLRCELTMAGELAIVTLQKAEEMLGLIDPQNRREDKAIVIFTPDEIQAKLDRNLAAGLRELAAAIEAGQIDGKLIDCQGNGLWSARSNDTRAHLMLRVDLAAPIRQVLEGESREEFERDRMGRTGEDNTRKLKGDSDVG